MDARKVFALTFRDQDDLHGTLWPIRFRRLLKRILREYGFRALRIEDVTTPPLPAKPPVSAAARRLARTA